MDILAIGPPVTTDIVSGSMPPQGRPGMPGFDAVPLAAGRDGPDGLSGRVGLQHQMDPNPLNGFNGHNNQNQIPLANTANGQNGSDGAPGLLTAITRTLTSNSDETYVSANLSSMLYSKGGYLSRNPGTDLDILVNKSGTYYIEWSVISSTTGDLISSPTMIVTPGANPATTTANGFVIVNLVAGDSITVVPSSPMVGATVSVNAILISNNAFTIIHYY